MTFDEAQALFRNEQIAELAAEAGGLRYLKLRSLSRKDYLEQLFRSAGVEPASRRARDMFREAFESARIDDSQIETVIRTIYEAERTTRRSQEDDLVSELYRLRIFDWGGLHQNSLEKTIVDNYVKKITSFDVLSDKIENELHNSMRGYVLCSWYNHWTSIIIEDVFRDHPAVLPAVGQVKKIDFFIHDVPFDLKVTYLPEGYVSERRRADGLRPELTLLRQVARRQSIHFANDMPNPRLLQDLWAKQQDHPSSECQGLIEDLRSYRIQLIDGCQSDPSDLMRWLYENQGVRRFDASNRLFLVLVDRESFFDSWKLKRAKPLLSERIGGYLDRVPATPGREVIFDWEGTAYTTLADVVFVIHP